jgi:uncharacterized membrane protein
MKITTVLTAVLMSICLASSAFAAGGARGDNSGVFVWMFLGFCALIVVVQVIPALLTLFGFAKGLSKNKVTETQAVKSR